MSWTASAICMPTALFMGISNPRMSCCSTMRHSKGPCLLMSYTVCCQSRQSYATLDIPSSCRTITSHSPSGLRWVPGLGRPLSLMERLRSPPAFSPVPTCTRRDYSWLVLSGMERHRSPTCRGRRPPQRRKARTWRSTACSASCRRAALWELPGACLTSRWGGLAGW